MHVFGPVSPAISMTSASSKPMISQLKTVFQPRQNIDRSRRYTLAGGITFKSERNADTGMVIYTCLDLLRFGTNRRDAEVSRCLCLCSPPCYYLCGIDVALIVVTYLRQRRTPP